MTRAEDDEVYRRRLSAALTEHGFGWVVEQVEAQIAEGKTVHPRASKALIAVECKFYTSSLQLHLGRGFLGLTSEIHREERYFVSNANSTNVAKLVGHHKAEWEFGVIPGASEANALLHRFARAFRNYKAGY